MTEPEFLEPDAVLFLHDQALREYGGLQGVKDEGLLHSALARAIDKLAYAGASAPDLFDLASAYAFGIASNHPFCDANKRTAWGKLRAVSEGERGGAGRARAGGSGADGSTGARWAG